jgi:hypothetical protein
MDLLSNAVLNLIDYLYCEGELVLQLFPRLV